MNVWTWFAVPPVVLLAAHYALGPLEKSVPPLLPAPPSIAALHLPPALTVAPAAAAVGYQRGGPPKDIRLAAFGIVVPAEVVRSDPRDVVPAARELFRLDSVLLAGDTRTAAINGNLYRVGDRLQRRYRLTQIEADAVWLRGPRGREVLRFPEFKDPPAPVVAAPQVVLQSPGAPALTSPSTAPANPGRLDTEYRKILEMLKL